VAIAYVAERGHMTANLLSGTLACTVTGTTTVGNRLFMLCSMRGGDVNPEFFQSLVVTDNKGNQWEVGAIGLDSSANDYCFIASCVVTVAHVNTDTVTATFGVSRGAGKGGTLQEFSGLDRNIYRDRDQYGFANFGSGSAVSVTTRGPTDVNEELVLLAATGSGSTVPWTVGAGYSEFTTKAQADGAAIPRTHYGEYKITTVPGVQTATATDTAATGWTGCVATYRADPGRLPDYSKFPIPKRAVV
jgi:hypothetical protein